MSVGVERRCEGGERGGKTCCLYDVSVCGARLQKESAPNLDFLKLHGSTTPDHECGQDELISGIRVHLHVEKQ